jgi:hypothetical protein
VADQDPFEGVETLFESLLRRGIVAINFIDLLLGA